MKKLVFMFVAFAAISFASCGNGAQNAEGTDSDSVVVADSNEVATDSNEVATDSVPTDTVVAPEA